MNAPNTTFDVYLAGRLPGAAPDFSALNGFLRDRWERGNKANEGDRSFFWTATLDVPLGSDLADLWPGAVSQTTVWMPDQNGDAYTVVFVERERSVPGNDFLRVYLVKGSVVAITVKEADNNPTLPGITTIIFDQADGFAVSQPAANQAQINLNITEQAQDAVGNAMINTSTVHPFYDDPNNQLSWNVQLQMSLTSDGSGVKLVGDAASPGNSQYYGTDGSGSKGYHALPAAGVTDHALLSDLAWSSSGHTGTASRVAGFDGGGAATLIAETGTGNVVLATSPTMTSPTMTSPTVTSPTIAGGTHTAITSLGIRSTGSGAFDLTIASTENLTAGRTLTITTNDANRLISLKGDLTTAGAFTTSGAFGITLIATATTSVTLPASGTLLTTTGDGSGLTNLPGANTKTEVTGTTTNAFATVFDITNSTGLHGSFSLKNTHGSNGLSYRVTVKDMYGTSGTGGTGSLTPGAVYSFCFDSSSPASSILVPPFQEVKIEVQDAIAGNHATYDSYRSVIG